VAPLTASPHGRATLSKTPRCSRRQ
jgi:hypothetical protein